MLIHDYLGYLKINDEESKLIYLLNEFGESYSARDNISITKLDIVAGIDSELADNLGEGCINIPKVNKTKYGDLTGREFGKLKVRCRDVERTAQTHLSYWICDCKCGNTKSIRGCSLTSGSTTSCGCNISTNTYDLDSEEYGIGYTKNGIVFFFDKEDYPIISKYKWSANAEGYIRSCYHDETGNTKSIKMHRLVMGVDDPKVFVDHIHHNHADNRKSELRIVTRQENSRNRQLNKNNTSGHAGVYYDKSSSRWVANIGANGRSKTIGTYSTKEEAIKAREEAEKRYFGEYRYQGTITTDQILNRN